MTTFVASNPFLNRTKITNPEEFFGREDIVENIVRCLTYPEPQSVAVVGERRYGKSSLLSMVDFVFRHKRCGKPILPAKYNDVLKMVDNKTVSVFIDPEEFVINDPDGFTWVVIDELVMQAPELAKFLEGRLASDAVPGRPRRRPEILLNHLLRSATAEGYRFVFLIDEFELLARSPKLRDVNYLHYLRGISDNYALAYVTASRRSPSEVSTEMDPAGSPFDNNFIKTLYLGLLQDADCTELIRGNLARLGKDHVEFTPAEEDQVIRLSGRHPYFLKMACSHLFEWARQHRPTHWSWVEGYQQEANEEFKRMWMALGDREKNWLLRAMHSSGIGIQEAKVHQALDSLRLRGLLQEDRQTGSLVLFASSFSDYLQGYVTALEREYQDIERHLEEGQVRWVLAELNAHLARLERLKAEWQLRGDKTSTAIAYARKCENLAGLMGKVLQLVIAMEAFDRAGGSEPARKTGHESAETALDDLIAVFEEGTSFGGDEGVSPDAGRQVLNLLVEYLEQKKRDQVFGNGYDHALAARIAFLRAHDFKGIGEVVERTFPRLMEVYDYQRAREVLQQRRAEPWKTLTGCFLRCPLLTVGALILLPVFAAGLIQSSPSLSTLGWVPIAVVYGIIMLFVVSLVFRRRNDSFPNAHRLRIQALLPWDTAAVALGCLAASRVVISESSSNPEPYWTLWMLMIAAGAGVAHILVMAACLRKKVQGFRVALMRAKYFYSYMFLIALWVGMLCLLCRPGAAHQATAPAQPGGLAGAAVGGAETPGATRKVPSTDYHLWTSIQIGSWQTLNVPQAMLLASLGLFSTFVPLIIKGQQR